MHRRRLSRRSWTQKVRSPAVCALLASAVCTRCPSITTELRGPRATDFTLPPPCAPQASCAFSGEGALRHVSVNGRSKTCCDGGAWWVLWATQHQHRRLRAVTLVSCGRFSVPHRVPSGHVVSHGLVSGVCLSSVFAKCRERHPNIFHVPSRGVS